MKRLIQKQFIFLLLIGLFIIPAPASIAMMGMGGGMGGMMGGQTGGGFGGMMGGQTGGGMGWGNRGSQYNRETMDRRTAENLAREYMDRHTSEPYRLGEMKEGDTYYMADIFRPNGERIERLLIDKQSGRIHSIR